MKDKPRYWNDVTISSVATAANEPLVGKTVAEIAGLRGVDPETCAMDLLVEENALVNIVSFNQSEENLRQLITHKLCSVITDGFYVTGQSASALVWYVPGVAGKTGAREALAFVERSGAQEHRQTSGAVESGGSWRVARWERGGFGGFRSGAN